MPQLIVAVHSNFSPQMDALRIASFAYPQQSSADEFEARSEHVTVRLDGGLAAYIRITSGPKSVVKTWTNGLAQTPTGPRIVDISRLAVGPTFRGLSLVGLVATAAMVHVAAQAFEQAVGSLLQGEPFQPVFTALGFLPCGPLVLDREPSGQSYTVQPILADLSGKLTQYRQMLDRRRTRFEEQGYRVTIEL